MPVEIKTLSKRDVDQYMELLRLGFGEELAQRGTDVARVERMTRVLLSCGGLPLRLIKAITGRGLFVLAAKDGPHVAGVLTVAEGKTPGLIGVYVREAYRGQGIALNLVQAALLRLKRRGYSQVHVSVIDHTAQLLAQRGGFVPCDHTDLYERSLPARTFVPDGLFARRVRKVSLQRHPYDLGPLNLVTGVRVRRIVVHSGEEATVAGMLIALPHQSMGEIQPQVLVPGREDTFRALLDAGCEWFSQLGRASIAVSLHDDTASLASILTGEGFVKRRSWVELKLDL